MKIVIIGAGSYSFGRGQITDILQAEEFKGQNVTLSLMDTSEERLELMTKFAGKIKEHTRTTVAIESNTDRRKVLSGADYVIISVARKRMELWEQEFRIPLSYGFRHCYGENGGPGAIFHALRSFELLIPICKDMEELCPEAQLLNFTNPEARVLNAICHLTKVKAVGICHGIFAAIDLISQLLQRPKDELKVVSAGMNHFYCVLRVEDKKTGKDLLGDVLKKVREEKNPPHHRQLFKKMVEIFDVFSYPSDDHIGEYFSFGSEFTGSKWPYGRESHRVHALDPMASPSILEECVNSKGPVKNEILKSSGESTVPIICDIEFDRKRWHPAVNVLNSEKYIENLPEHGVVEVPAIVDAKGIHPQKVGSISEPWAAYIRTQHSIHQLLVEAYRTKSKKFLLQALLLDPLVNSVTAAEKMLDEMLELEGDFLPSFP